MTSKSDDTISVTIADKKSISDQRRTQLDKARGLAIVSRREKQRRAIEDKLRELKVLQSNDMNQEMLYRVASKMIEVETNMRLKQNELTKSVDSNLGLILEQNDKTHALLERILRYYQPRPTPSNSPMTSTHTVRK
jgi:vacuolar-type H+-ATPase subunit I/STV1